jgi:hypothetical protein
MNGRSVTVLSLPAAVNAAGTRSAWRHGDGIVIDDVAVASSAVVRAIGSRHRRP